MIIFVFDFLEIRVVVGDVIGCILIWENVGDRVFVFIVDGVERIEKKLLLKVIGGGDKR